VFEKKEKKKKKKILLHIYKKDLALYIYAGGYHRVVYCLCANVSSIYILVTTFVEFENPEIIYQKRCNDTGVLFSFVGRRRQRYRLEENTTKIDESRINIIYSIFIIHLCISRTCFFLMCREACSLNIVVAQIYVASTDG
jgi:hypothetical protein